MSTNRTGGSWAQNRATRWPIGPQESAGKPVPLPPAQSGAPQTRSEVQPFTFAPGLDIRSLMREGEPWFVASDIAHALGYSHAPHMVRLLDEDEVDSVRLEDSIQRGNPNVTVISESGLYAAILRSTKAEAKAFRKWVTGIVLPSIRQHGAYAKGAEQLPDAAQAALYAHFRDILKEALRRYDRATEHDHWRSFDKQAQRSHATAAQVVEQMGLPPSVVAALVAQGVDGGLKALGSSPR